MTRASDADGFGAIPYLLTPVTSPEVSDEQRQQLIKDLLPASVLDLARADKQLTINNTKYSILMLPEGVLSFGAVDNTVP